MRKGISFFTLLSFAISLSGCTNTVVLSPEELEEVHQNNIVGLQLENDREIMLDDSDEVHIDTVDIMEKNLFEDEEEDIRLESFLYLKKPGVTVDEIPTQSIRFLYVNDTGYADVISRISPDEYSSRLKAEKKMQTCPLTSVVDKNEQLIKLQSGYFDRANRFIIGELKSGERYSVPLDSLQFITYSKFNVGNTIAAVVCLGIIVTVVSVAIAFKDYDIFGQKNKQAGGCLEGSR
ncbi:MAG: hypothetical protein JW763_01280 [candidate division Zixibacteria bacterium]|nr:hypothetical protein [candidate division Zixibacteria bacterium]